ncbi:MAG TPA: cytochrome c oxidase assembly protein [Burkholderiaceae bacterium]
MRALTFVLLAALPAAAIAHQLGSGTSRSFGLETLLAFMMVASVAGYAKGVATLWRRAGAGRGIRVRQVVAFGAGWGTLVVALYSPVDTLADRSFAAHMTQHELLMIVAAPLLAASRTYEAWSWALRKRGVRALATLATAWRWLAVPTRAWWLHAAALWLWHVPALFLAALRDEDIHALQHASFFLSALLFWWAVFGSRRRNHQGTALALLVTTMLQMNALGLLLTFAPQPWYAADEPPLWGLTALEDQQVGALIMWMFGGMVYAAAALAVVLRWLGPSSDAASQPPRVAP